MDDNLQIEMKMALGFAKTIKEAKGEFAPLLILGKGENGHEHMAIGAPPITNQESKESVTGIFAVAARAWEATQVLLVVDSYYVRYSEDEPPPDPSSDDFVPPSEDPRASEAIMVTAFRTDAEDVGFLCPYHHTPDGIVFEQDEALPEDSGGAGMIPEVFHRALSMTDQQVSDVLASAPVDGGISSMRELLLMMEGMGFAVIS